MTQLDQLQTEFDEQQLPFPTFIRADLEEDQRNNAGTLLQEYELES